MRFSARQASYRLGELQFSEGACTPPIAERNGSTSPLFRMRQACFFAKGLRSNILRVVYGAGLHRQAAAANTAAEIVLQCFELRNTMLQHGVPV